MTALAYAGSLEYPALDDAPRPPRIGPDFSAFWIRLDAGQVLVRHAARLLSADELARAARFHRAVDRDRYTVFRASLRALLGDALGLPAGSIGFTHGTHGKPGLMQPADVPLRFNASRSGEFGFIAFAIGQEIGADIERIRPLDEVDDLVDRYFSASERLDYAGLSEKERLSAFYAGWTRKEAVIKALGLGLSMDLGSFDVALQPSTAGEELQLSSVKAMGQKIRLSSWNESTVASAVAIYAAQEPLTETRQVAGRVRHNPTAA